MASAEYCNYMIKEILEEPEVIKRTISEEISRVKKAANEIYTKEYEMIYMVGSGTSYHAGLAAQYALSNLANFVVSIIPASEFKRWVPLTPSRKALLVAISQSGESSDVIDAARDALRRKIDILAITNTPESTLANLANYTIYPRSGKEVAIPATKTYVTQLTSIFMLALELAELKGAVEHDIESLREKLYNIPVFIEEIFKSSMDKIRECARKHKERNPVFILGSGPNYATALEAALKFKETCVVFSEGFAAREFLHGPIRLVDERTLMILVSCPDEVNEYIEMSRSFRRLGAAVISVLESGEESISLAENSDEPLYVPQGVPKIFSPILFIVPIQLLVYFTSIFKGLNPDKPEKLVKVVK
jgi:glucosamine--fructose-6-phosphate aminotransferase (isomerizing)